MNLQTFSAATMAEALIQVKRVLGHDAVILHTRTVRRRQWLRMREMVEVTAGPASMHERSPRRRVAGIQDDTRAVPTRTPAAGRVASGASSAAAAAYGRPAVNPAVAAPSSAANNGGGAKTMLQSPEMAQIMVKLVTEEVTGLRTDFKALVEQIKRAPSINGPTVPAELTAHYDRLIDSGVSSSLAEDLLKAVRLQLTPAHLNNDGFVREKIAEQVDRLLPVAGPIHRTKAVGPHIVALIGPTGVGKTTTIAKLAANLQLQQGRRVGLITLDTFRIAAVDQLKRYAEIIGSPLKVVSSAEEIKVAIDEMKSMDYILIDTAGRSPTDSMKLSELRGLIDAANPDEVHLVLSTTSDSRCLDLAVNSFSRVRCDRILFTKIDETASVGVVLNIAQKVGKPLSYLTTGQDVPYDIEVAKGREIARLVLGASPKTVEMKPSVRPDVAGSAGVGGGGVSRQTAGGVK